MKYYHLFCFITFIIFIIFAFCTAFLCQPQSVYSNFKDFIISGNYSKNYSQLYDGITSPSSTVGMIEALGSSHLPISKTISASDVMVDVTNELAFAIMYQHSLYNRNNIAFSPTSLMSVLIALYEGSTGQSSNQLKLALNLPDSKDIVRVGHRDIQRRLKTYIIDSHNPLKGLTFNKENIALLPNYEVIMTFYGYNLGMSTLPSTTALNQFTELKRNTNSNIDFQNHTNQTIDNKENIDESIQITTTTIDTEMKRPTNSTSALVQPEETTIGSFDQPIIKSENKTFNSTIKKSVTRMAEMEIINPQTTTVSLHNVNASQDEQIALPSTESSLEMFARLQKPTEVYRMRSNKQSNSRLILDSHSSTLTPKKQNNQSSLHTNVDHKSALMLRRKRQPFHHYIHPPYNTYNTKTYQLIVNHSNHSDLNLTPAVSDSNSDNTPNVQYNPNRFFNSSQVRENHITHNFYINDRHIIYTVFKVYNAILFYKHFDDIQMTAVEMELNSSEYNLIIFLPDSKNELINPIIYIKFALNMRILRTVLKPKFVQIIIPDIHLNGDVYLTNDLQNMGICDIFEPNQANLQTMSNDKDIYVKHIQQMIKINLGIQTINSKLNDNHDIDQTQPIQVSVNHPFMFFIMDRHLNIAIMAGRILNPLNVRIQ